MTIWIGISGPTASGKSTLAFALYVNMKNNAAVIPFDMALKTLIHGVQLRLDGQEDGRWRSPALRRESAIRYACGFLARHDPVITADAASAIGERIVDVIAKEKDYRAVLRVVGDEIVRGEVNQDFWVNIVKRQLSLFDVVISDDVRFLNEAYAVSSLIYIDVSKERAAYAERLKSVTGGSDESLDDSIAPFADIRIPFSYNVTAVERALKERHLELAFEDVVY